MERLNKILNDDPKTQNRFTKNYFYIGTITIIIINILLFTADKYAMLDTGGQHWSDLFYFSAIIQAFCNSFSHFNLQHVLLNMLCFFVCGLYLERKTGSIVFILLVLAMAFFTSSAISANDLSVSWAGYSGVNYGLYAYIIIGFLFSFIKSKTALPDLIFGAVVIALIYLAMCFDGGTASFGFKWYPYDLMYNLGHYTSFVAGSVFALAVQTVKLISEKSARA